MTSRSAQAVCETLVQGQMFLLEYFSHIKHQELVNYILAKMLHDGLEVFLDVFQKWSQATV